MVFNLLKLKTLYIKESLSTKENGNCEKGKSNTDTQLST